MRRQDVVICICLFLASHIACSSSPTGTPFPGDQDGGTTTLTGAYRTVGVTCGAYDTTTNAILYFDGHGSFHETGLRATLGVSSDDSYSVSGKASTQTKHTLELIPKAGNTIQGFLTDTSEVFVCAPVDPDAAGMILGIRAAESILPLGSYHIFILTRHTDWLARAIGSITFDGNHYDAIGTVAHSGEGYIGSILHFAFGGRCYTDPSGWLIFDKLWRAAISASGDLLLFSTVSDTSIQEIGLAIRTAQDIQRDLDGTYRGLWLTWHDRTFGSRFQTITFYLNGTCTSDPPTPKMAGTYELEPDGRLALNIDEIEVVSGAVDPDKKIIALIYLGDLHIQRFGVFIRE